MRLKAQFWIKYRGHVDVDMITIPQGWTADDVAHYCVNSALTQFERKWPGPHRDELVCTGVSNGERTLHSKDLPQ